jgi:hypothetical protein
MGILKRVLGTGVTVVLTFLALGDAPNQLASWKRGWDQFVGSVDWSGSIARWLFVLAAVLVGSWAWDVHVRLLSKVRPDWLAKWQLSKWFSSNQMNTLKAALISQFDDVGARLTNIETRLDGIATSESVGALRKELEDLQIKTGHHPLVKLLVEAEMALRIVSARYGIDENIEHSVDVQEAVRGFIKDNRIDIVVTNDTMGTGNIFADQRKKLFVEYTCPEFPLPRKVVVIESHKLVLPEPITLGKLMTSWGLPKP